MQSRYVDGTTSFPTTRRADVAMRHTRSNLTGALRPAGRLRMHWNPLRRNAFRPLLITVNIRVVYPTGTIPNYSGAGDRLRAAVVPLASKGHTEFGSAACRRCARPPP